MGYSRRFFAWAAIKNDAEHTYESLIRSFEWFGGVTQQVLVDNQKAAVISHPANGQVRFNEGFLMLAEHYGFTPKACKPYRARTVVDPELKVIGVVNLRVADCSIIPSPVSAHTNSVAVMIGEKAADLIAREHNMSITQTLSL